MATYLLYATQQNQRCGSGRNTVLASGATEADARAAAVAAAPDGETKVHPDWAAELISATDNLTAPIWIQGQVAEPLQRSRGA